MVQEYLITSEFYPEDTVLSEEQARAFSEREEVDIVATSILYATRVFNDGSYQPAVFQNQDSNGSVNVDVSYTRSERISTMVLNQRILVIDVLGTDSGLNVRVSYQDVPNTKAAR